MLRRTFLKSVPVAAAAPLALGQALAPKRVFTVVGWPAGEPASPNSRIMSLLIYEGKFFALKYLSGPKSYFLATADNLGSSQSELPLPSSVYWGLAARESTGTLLTLRKETARSPVSFLDEYTLKGKPIRRLTGGARASHAMCTTDDVFVQIHKDASCEIRDLNTGAVSAYANVCTGFRFFSVHRAGRKRVVVVDNANARLASIDVSTGTSTQAPLSAPAVTASTAYYQKELARFNPPPRADGTRLVPGTPRIVFASATDSSGFLYCLISPVDPKGAHILKFDSLGRLVSMLTLMLPDRSSYRWKVPDGLLISGSTVFLSYPDGVVASYSA